MWLSAECWPGQGHSIPTQDRETALLSLGRVAVGFRARLVTGSDRYVGSDMGVGREPSSLC